MLDYKELYFASDTNAVELDIGQVLTSVGMAVYIGGKAQTNMVKWAHDFGDLGGEPEGLDCTPLSAKVTMEKAGNVEQESWTIDYYYNSDDYDMLEKLKSGGETKELYVVFDDGTYFENKGVVQANYLSGQSVNSVADAHAVVELSSADGWTRGSGFKQSSSS